MTPQQETAREIVIKMQFQKEPLMFEQAKQCAIIAVDEILAVVLDSPYANIIKYYQEVKQEIEKL
jgi:hypothetical protein